MQTIIYIIGVYDSLYSAVCPMKCGINDGTQRPQQCKSLKQKMNALRKDICLQLDTLALREKRFSVNNLKLENFANLSTQWFSLH